MTGLDRTVIDSPNRKVGIVTAGKSYLDVRQALDDLGIDEQMAKDIGLSLYKVAMTWPLEPQGIRAFCEGLDEVLVIEEKRPVIEPQIKEQLYNWQGGKRPRVIGKFDRDLPDEPGDWLLPSYAELNPAQIGRAISTLLRRHGLVNERLESRLRLLADLEKRIGAQQSPLKRIPHFCSGCPHNTSTKVPEGSRALAGIGCHYMVQWMDPNTETFTQMGGEGVPWVGQAPFSKTKHVFANIGDGTYFHSGLMAIRQAVAADVNITYKILFNDAVAMTGGQPHDGPLNPVMIAHQVIAEGVKRVVVVSDEPEKYPLGTNWGPNVTLEHRIQALPSLSMTRPARRRSAGAASVGPSPIRPNGSSLTTWSAKAAATARFSPTVSRSCRWRRSSAPSARSTSRAATRTSPASKASAPPS